MSGDSVDRIWRNIAADAPISVRLFEVAVGVREMTLQRLVLATFAGAIAAMLLPLPQAGAWFAGAMLLEVWVWRTFVPFRRGETVDRDARTKARRSFFGLIMWWIALGVMLWTAPTLAAHVCALIVTLTLAAVILVRFFSTPAAFVVLGAAPVAGGLWLEWLNDGRGWREEVPILLALGLSLFFGLGRALKTPSAQLQQRVIAATLRELQIVTDNVNDVISWTDLRGVHTYVSPSVERVLGYRPAELIGVSRGGLVAREDRGLLRDALGRMLADPERSEIINYRVRHKDGRWIWFQTNARIISQHGRPVATIDVSRDVTEQVLKDIALHKAKVEAESGNRAKAEFMANLSHEFRTPMNGILGALQLIEDEPISVEGRLLMRQASDCGRMLTQLLNDVIDLSKIDSGEFEVAAEQVNVADALNAVCDLLQGQASAKGLAFHREIRGDAPWILGDPTRLRQVMWNLLGNAIKFTDRGHVIARLNVTATPDGQRHVRLEVEDTGVGVPEAEQPHLFERFRQSESTNSRRFGGTGLGLSISRSLARLMGGDIGLTSVEGVGSTFWLDLTAAAAEPTPDEASESGLLDGLRVLLVEDNPTNRLVARTMLTRLGASVDEAEDGLIGLDRARNEDFDLILMDVQMPNMDGIEATRAIRALARPASAVPIIALTANVMAHQQIEYRAAGMNGVVAKPISAEALIAQIVALSHEEGSAIAV